MFRECPHCGKEIHGVTHVCPHCRRSLAELDQNNRGRTSPLPPSDKAASPQPSRRLTQILFSPLAVFVLIAILFAFSLFFYKGTENELREDAPESEAAPAIDPIAIERQAPLRRYEITDITESTTPAVDMKMRRMSLEQAIRIVDTGLVRHGGDWITPEE